jgi:hypothetical protein
MSQQFHQDHDGEDDAQMPLGTGGEAAPAEDYVESKPKVNNSTVALIGSFAAALVVLYLLGLQNKPRAASAEQLARDLELNQRIDVLLNDKGGQGKIENFFDATSRLLAKLRDRFERKTGEVEFGANPFEQVVARTAPVGDTSAAVVVLREDPAKAAQLRKLAEEFDKLKLDGVMMGSSPTALINKQMLTVGMKLGSFTIKQVKDGEVQLSYDNEGLQMHEVFRLVEKQK